jgi:sulfur relay protein TusB/DsrH
MISSCSIIIRKPLGQEPAVLGVRAAWAMLTNGGIDVRIILLGEGVYSLLGKTGYLRSMYERFLGEEGEVFAAREDLEARGIDPKDLPAGVEVVPSAELADIVDKTRSVMTF